jgi:hypothetical protein
MPTVEDIAENSAKNSAKKSASLAASPERVVAALIFVFLVFHLVLTATLGLGVDECYTIGVSHDLKLFYYDHPPLHYWIAHAFMPLLGDGRALRLPFVAMFAATSWLMYLLARQMFGARAGIWAVLALNLSGFFTLAGGWVVPDGPLMLCLTAAAYTIARALFPFRAPPSPWWTWICAGLWIGLAGLAKYHVVFFVIGLLVYVVSAPQRRRLLLSPAPWAGAAVALALVTPVIVANAEHHWASFAFQGGRALTTGSFPKIGQFLANLGGQCLWMLPWIFVPMVIAAYQALRRGRGDDRSWYCLCLGSPAIVLFTLVPLWGDRGLPHWQMAGWLMLFPVLGDHLAREAQVRSRPRTWAVTSAALLVGLAALFLVNASTGFSKLVAPSLFPEGDPTLEAYEWTPLHDELRRRGFLDGNKRLFVVSGSWIDIGRIDQALHDALPMQVFGESKQYAFRYDPESLVGRDALVISRRDQADELARRLAGYFVSIQELPPFAFGRSGMKEIELRLFYARALTRPLPSPYDERPDDKRPAG